VGGFGDTMIKKEKKQRGNEVKLLASLPFVIGGAHPTEWEGGRKSLKEKQWIMSPTTSH